MKQKLVRLNLIFAPDLEEAVAEAMACAPDMPGFTLLRAEGHSADFTHASPGEQVRGRVERCVLWVVIEHERLDAVLAALRQQVSSREVRWWTEPVLAGGRLI